MVSDNIQFVDPIISAMLLPEAILISFPVPMFVFGVVSIEVWKSDLPIWGIVLALCIGVVIGSASDFLGC